MCTFLEWVFFSSSSFVYCKTFYAILMLQVISFCAFVQLKCYTVMLLTRKTVIQLNNLIKAILSINSTPPLEKVRSCIHYGYIFDYHNTNEWSFFFKKKPRPSCLNLLQKPSQIGKLQDILSTFYTNQTKKRATDYWSSMDISINSCLYEKSMADNKLAVLQIFIFSMFYLRRRK